MDRKPKESIKFFKNVVLSFRFHNIAVYLSYSNLRSEEYRNIQIKFIFMQIGSRNCHVKKWNLILNNLFNFLLNLRV